VEKESPYIAAYALLAYGVNKAKSVFFTIDYDRYQMATTGELKSNPRKVVFVNLVDHKNNMWAYTNAEFQRQYSAHPDATYLEAGTYQDLLQKLAALPQDSSFDRIEIYGHARPGLLAIGRKEKIELSDLAKLEEAKLKIAAPNADLRFISCSLGANTMTEDKGEKFVSALAKALLPRGGTAIAATRNIELANAPARIFRALDLVSGVAPLKDIAEIAPLLNRDFRQVQNSFVEIRVPDPEGSLPIPKSQSYCPTYFGNMVMRYPRVL
jgi:hypothetical protein